MEGIHLCGKSGPLVACVTFCSFTKRKTYTQLTMLGHLVMMVQAMSLLKHKKKARPTKY